MKSFGLGKQDFTRLPLLTAVSLSTAGSLAAQMGASFSFQCIYGSAGVGESKKTAA